MIFIVLIQCKYPVNLDLLQNLKGEHHCRQPYLLAKQLESCANLNNAVPHHITTSNPLVDASPYKAMMRGSCKQLISSLFAHMCLTPHSPQWILALCSDTISSASMDHLEKPPIPLLVGLFCPHWLVLRSARIVQPVCPPSQVPIQELASEKLKKCR